MRRLLDDDDYSSESDPGRKFRKSRNHPSNSRIKPNVFDIICLSVGVIGIIFSTWTILRSDPVGGSMKSTSRELYSTKITRRLDGNTGDLVHLPKLLAVVGVRTSVWSGDRRAALRTTWFPSNPGDLLRLEKETGLAFRFVIGRSKDAIKMAELEKEAKTYKDFMVIDVEEENSNIPHKMLAFFKMAFEHFEADYYVKADEDIYLRPDRLAILLAKKRTRSLTYIGCMKKGPVMTDPRMKWYEKLGHLTGNEYFLHAHAPLYILSAEVVALLAVARNNSLRMFSKEDVTIGSWMLGMNVEHEDNRALCDPRCTPTSIAVWDMKKCSGLCNPAIRMKELHNLSMCSKTPALPDHK